MIRAEQLSKSYGEFQAVSDLSFTIASGECVGFLGLNGAGKSTTLRMLAGVLEPSSGSLVIDGLDAVDDAMAIRRRVGYLPERPPLYDEMSVGDYLLFAAALRDVDKAERHAAVDAVMLRCDLLDVADAAIGTLSHGYRQRVGIAQAIVHGPSLLILDEPTQGLDPVQIAEMRRLIAALRGDHTILLSTHLLSEIEATCDRILVLDEGRIALAGTEAELIAQAGAALVANFSVRGEVDAIRAALAAVDAPGGDVEIRAIVADPAHGEGVWRVAVGVADDSAIERAAAALVGAGLGLRGLRREDGGLLALFAALRHDGGEGGRDDG
jgi:ABC-2 type transport system ATP-binding protein